MTYGWAILIIAVVLGVLYSVGVFNLNMGPKALTGACQVYRPDGPGTINFINLAGSCANELPEYVAQFNGQNSYVQIANSPSLNPANALTLAVWYKINSYQPTNMWAQIVGKGINAQYDIAQQPGNPAYVGGSAVLTNGQIWANAMNSPLNTWEFFVITYSATTGNIISYENGVSLGPLSGSGTIVTTSDAVFFGVNNFQNAYFNGSIANVQIYNTTLSANEIDALYQEGIGGAPIRLNNIVGWWPLNGNANDYSGNNNNGQATNVIYTSSWTSGYSAP